jgi:hypothetical protein
LPGRRARCPWYDPLRPGRTSHEIDLNAEHRDVPGVTLDRESVKVAEVLAHV